MVEGGSGTLAHGRAHATHLSRVLECLPHFTKPVAVCLLADRNKASRLVVYCRSLNMVADRYSHIAEPVSGKLSV